MSMTLAKGAELAVFLSASLPWFVAPSPCSVHHIISLTSTWEDEHGQRVWDNVMEADNIQCLSLALEDCVSPPNILLTGCAWRVDR